MSRPDFFKYSVTTFDPGARLVLTHGCRFSPRSTAFFATSPAPIITLGFEVFVQLVIAAIPTAPWSSAVATAGASASAAPAARPVTADTWAEPAASAPFFADDTIIEGSAA